MIRRPRSTPAPRRAALAIAAGLALVACADEPELQRWRGAHLEYGHEPELTPCAGTRSHMDQVIPFYAAQLGLDPASFDTITYAWLGDASWNELAPPNYRTFSGFAEGSRTIARGPRTVHELVHAIVNQRTGGSGLTLFKEGIAVALEEEWDVDGFRYEPVDPRPQLGLPASELNYTIAGAFAAYLLTRGGAERYLTLLERTREDTDRRRLDAVFDELYGAPVDAVVDDYLGAHACPEGAAPIPLPPSCMAPERPWADPGRRWALARLLSCDDDDAVGGVSHGENRDDAPLVTSATIVIDDPGDYRLRLVGDGAYLGLVRCGGCPFLRRDASLPRAGELELELEAGPHALTIYADPEVESEVIVTLERD
ncbi:MAG: hypothetical protein R3B09_20695 [Nannocystaceae bacterium]